jgi:hypothetical protein
MVQPGGVLYLQFTTGRAGAMTLPRKQNLFVLNRIFFDFEKFNPLWINPFENHA